MKRIGGVFIPFSDGIVPPLIKDIVDPPPKVRRMMKPPCPPPPERIHWALAPPRYIPLYKRGPPFKPPIPPAVTVRVLTEETVWVIDDDIDL